MFNTLKRFFLTLAGTAALAATMTAPAALAETATPPGKDDAAACKNKTDSINDALAQSSKDSKAGNYSAAMRNYIDAGYTLALAVQAGCYEGPAQQAILHVHITPPAGPASPHPEA
jgi:hypothetical protein